MDPFQLQPAAGCLKQVTSSVRGVVVFTNNVFVRFTLCAFITCVYVGYFFFLICLYLYVFIKVLSYVAILRR